MNNAILSRYAGHAWTSFIPEKMSGKIKQSGTQISRFLDMAVQINQQKIHIPAANLTDSECSIDQISSLEIMLKAKYPKLIYHVFDASSNDWKTRNDYPHYLLYQEGDQAKETLENWQPVGENPFYGSIDGRFIAPKEIHALGKVLPGSKAVIIHPSIQECMEQDPDYAQEIMAKIDTWFAFDRARDEAILPGSTWGMSQAVAIGEDGNICNACSSNSRGEITFSQSSDEMVQAYYLRMKKHADLMHYFMQEQLKENIQNRRLEAMKAESKISSII